MKADPRFQAQSKEFWANVRTISQEIGYTNRGAGTILIPNITQIREAFSALSLSIDHIVDEKGVLTDFGTNLIKYFEYRAHVLDHSVKDNLMNKDQAEAVFNELRQRLNPKCPLPMNKQKGDKAKHNFLTGMVNMLIEANIGGVQCNYDPRSLTTITHDNMPLRTLSRRVDGAFPSVVNPIAIWEIKEYYYTTTFGSRVADGVYETLLDGHELEELESAADRKIQHILMVDAYFTWWIKGKSYLCRIIDMLHMGFIDEVLFGREVVERLPILAKEWKRTLDQAQIRIG